MYTRYVVATYKHMCISQHHQSSRTHPSTAHSTHADPRRPCAEVRGRMCLTSPPLPPTSPSQTTLLFQRRNKIIIHFTTLRTSSSHSQSSNFKTPRRTLRKTWFSTFLPTFFRIDMEQQPRSQILTRCGILRLCAASVLGRAVMDVAARVRRSITQLRS
jgi:hypothetical protein